MTTASCLKATSVRHRAHRAPDHRLRSGLRLAHRGPVVSLMPQHPSDDGSRVASGWQARTDGSTTVLTLAPDWTGLDAIAQLELASSALDRTGVRALSLEATEPFRWNSSLLVFVSMLRQRAALRSMTVNETGLPRAARDLLQLLSAPAPLAIVPRRRRGVREWLGSWAIDLGAQCGAISSLLGQQILGTIGCLRGRTVVRRIDLLTSVRDAGVAALPMVALVNLMVGGILAFVGGVQLRRLRGLGLRRRPRRRRRGARMAPLMTAIVMSGRTGSAYAAELAVDAGKRADRCAARLRNPDLRLPGAAAGLAALAAMMPLCTYACAIGIWSADSRSP